MARKVINEIIALGNRPHGWNSYGASKVAPTAQLHAIDLVSRFEDLGEQVPPPDVGASADGGVILRWEAHDGDVEIVFMPDGEEYSVSHGDRTIAAGRVAGLDPLKDVVRKYVVDRLIER